jgi:transcriptional regulator with PAS, ATPase and Fis domain
MISPVMRAARSIAERDRRSVMDEVIAAEKGNLSRAAERLGVSVRTLQRRARARTERRRSR